MEQFTQSMMYGIPRKLAGVNNTRVDSAELTKFPTLLILYHYAGCFTIFFCQQRFLA